MKSNKDKIEKRIMDLLLELNNNGLYVSATLTNKEGLIKEIKFKRVNKHGCSD